MQKELTTRIAAMYLGGDCEFEWLVDSPEHLPIERKKGDKDQNYISVRRLGWMELGYIKAVPKLRRLESIAEEEAKELFFQYCGKRYEDVYTDDDALGCWWNMTEEWSNYLNTLAIGEPPVWVWLLSKGFDLFGLIDSGLAIEIK